MQKRLASILRSWANRLDPPEVDVTITVRLDDQVTPTLNAVERALRHAKL